MGYDEKEGVAKKISTEKIGEFFHIYHKKQRARITDFYNTTCAGIYFCVGNFLGKSDNKNDRKNNLRSTIGDLNFWGRKAK